MIDYPNAKQPGDHGHPLTAHPANYTPLTPIGFLKRSAEVYPDHIALRYATKTRSWQQVYQRCIRLAASMNAQGIVAGDVVAVIAPNIPELFEMHYAAAMAGATLNAINTRLEATTISYILDHGGAKWLFVDRESTPLVRTALETLTTQPKLVDINDACIDGEPISELSYEQLIDEGDENYDYYCAQSDWESISLSYTSGTTGKPKGVVYHHRGAYLNALSNITGWTLPAHPTYLWTLPMFPLQRLVLPVVAGSGCRYQCVHSTSQC